MRELIDASRLDAFMRALAAAADRPVRVYFTGGATAVLRGWRQSTIDEGELFRYPAIDPRSFRRAVEAVAATSG